MLAKLDLKTKGRDVNRIHVISKEENCLLVTH